jgi:hypothetical protein
VRNEIIVTYSDAWRERELARIPGIYKYRDRVEALLKSLNRKYFGYGRFYMQEITYAGKPMEDQRTLDRIRRNRIKRGLDWRV